MPDAGNLNFWIQFRNFSQHPVHYQFEYIDIRLGTRAIQRVRTGNISGYMARGVGRTTIIKGFSKAELKEFYDGSSPAEGSVEFSLVYGPAEGPPERRFKMEIDIFVLLFDQGKNFGWQDNIKSESDEPYVPA